MQNDLFMAKKLEAMKYTKNEILRDLAAVAAKGRGWAFAQARLQKNVEAIRETWASLSASEEQKLQELLPILNTGDTTAKTTDRF